MCKHKCSCFDPACEIVMQNVAQCLLNDAIVQVLCIWSAKLSISSRWLRVGLVLFCVTILCKVLHAHDQSYECYLLKIASNKELHWSVCSYWYCLLCWPTTLCWPLGTSGSHLDIKAGLVIKGWWRVHNPSGCSSPHLSPMWMTSVLLNVCFPTHIMSNSCHLILGQFIISNSDPIWSLLH